MRRNPYIPTAGSIYFYFILYGMALIIVSQNKSSLMEMWGATDGQIAFAISGVGIGKIIGPAFAGFVSDKFGRKAMLLTSLLMSVVYFAGMVNSPNYKVGFVLSVWFGLANAILDVGAYPALMEAFPKKAGSANLLVKAAIAIGQLLLPILVAGGLFWKTSFYGAATAIGLCFILVCFLKFPDHKALAAEAKAKALAVTAVIGEKAGAKIWVEGAALVFFGFTSVGTFWLAQNSLPGMGEHIAGMGEAGAKTLVSLYATGSLIGVFTNAGLVARWVKPVRLLVVNPIITTIAYVLLLTSDSPSVYRVSSFLVGFFAAGGLFQLTVVVLAEFFPARKGLVTSLIGLASGVAAFLLPFLTGVILGDAEGAALVGPYRGVVWLGIGVAVISALLGVLVNIRHRIVFGHDVAEITSPELTAAN
ncbi:MFS transporter [Cellulomonas chengniuliangii]|uniref:MFS transporter n=1 Tax=Cellulomonas chengniuliangii TaxID=2968084 RepID=A0ABY5L213_9CELL|nr:MFS transporter [Cellulomonas chengniuliangii]MCC2308473.1 MFS transporter [Cellulomonas chengniuliangii]MCC2317490.1 MFS transporter [Cellulomonas chengniuliangii]UUI76846.1 MFS transporter [Cellulomonas chengniuliangii]